MSTISSNDPNLGQNILLLQINKDLAVLGKYSIEASSSTSEKVATALGALYASMENVEKQVDKPFAERRVVMEQAAKVLEEVEQLSGASGDIKAQAAQQADKKEAGGIVSESVRQCRTFLKEKREKMEWDNFNSELNKLFPKGFDEGARKDIYNKTKSILKLINKLPPDIAQGIEFKFNKAEKAKGPPTPIGEAAKCITGFIKMGGLSNVDQFPKVLDPQESISRAAVNMLISQLTLVSSNDQEIQYVQRVRKNFSTLVNKLPLQDALETSLYFASLRVNTASGKPVEFSVTEKLDDMREALKLIKNTHDHFLNKYYSKLKLPMSPAVINEKASVCNEIMYSNNDIRALEMAQKIFSADSNNPLFQHLMTREKWETLKEFNSKISKNCEDLNYLANEIVSGPKDKVDDNIHAYRRKKAQLDADMQAVKKIQPGWDLDEKAVRILQEKDFQKYMQRSTSDLNRDLEKLGELTKLKGLSVDPSDLSSVLSAVYTNVAAGLKDSQTNLEKRSILKQAALILDKIDNMREAGNKTGKEADVKGGKDADQMTGLLNECRKYIETLLNKVDQEFMGNAKKQISEYFSQHWNNSTVEERLDFVLKLISLLPDELAAGLIKTNSDSMQHGFMLRFFASIFRRPFDMQNLNRFSGIFDPAAPYSKPAINMVVDQMRVINKDLVLDEEAQATIQRIINNFDAVKHDMPAQDAIEAAIYFSWFKDMPIIGKSMEAMGPFLNMFKVAVDAAYEDLAVLTLLPIDEEEMRKKLEDYTTNLHRCQYGLEMTTKIIPNLNVDDMTKGLATARDCEELSKLNSSIAENHKKIAKMTEEYRKSGTKDFEEWIKTYRSIKAMLEVDMKAVKTILPKWELNTQDLKMFSDAELNELAEKSRKDE